MEQSLHRVYRASKVCPPLPREPWCAISESRGFAGLGRCYNSSDERKRGTTYGSRHATLACLHTLNRCSLDGSRATDDRVLRLASRGSWPVSTRPVVHALRSDPSWVLTRIHLPLKVAACALSVQQQGDLARGRMASGSPIDHRVTRSYIPHIHTFDPPERPPTTIA